MRRLFLLVPVLLLGCENECQMLCQEMADYAEECKLDGSWSEEQVDTCKDDRSKQFVTEAQVDACEAALPSLRDEWTCDDLEDYFDEEGSSSDADAAE